MEQEHDDSESHKELFWTRSTTPLSTMSRPATPLSRPSTPKWWRPRHPPETYEWEEIRRKRERGGYPWNYLDRDADGRSMSHFSDNLYEPVDPRPYNSSANIKKDPETTSLDDRLIEIPPELDIVTSEGLDGLDQVDVHDFGFDGDKEWHHYPEEMGDARVPKVFAAGIRKEMPKYGETSSERPLMTKTVPGTGGDQQVPQSTSPEGASGMSNALTQLKHKADQVKKQLSKISLPAKPNWSGIISKKKRKTDDGSGLEDEDMIEQTPDTLKAEGKADELSRKAKPPIPPPPSKPTTSKTVITTAAYEKPKFDTEEPQPEDEFNFELAKPKEPPIRMMETNQVVAAQPGSSRQIEDIKPQPLQQTDSSVLKDQAAAEQLRLARVAERKLKEKSQDELKKLKLDEKLEKEKVQEELKRIKAEEKAAKDKIKEEKKKAELEDKLLRKKQEDELKRARAEEERKAYEAEEAQRRNLVEQQKAVGGELLVGQPKPTIKFEVETTKQQQQELGESKPSTSAKLQAEKNKLKDEEKQKQQLLKQEAKKQKVMQEEKFEDAEIFKNEEAPKEKKSKRADAFKRKFAEIDFTKKFKRSKTPPGRPDEPPKVKVTKEKRGGGETDNKLAAQYAKEIRQRDIEMEREKEQEQKKQRLHEPIIYVTQPSVETTADSESHSLAGQQPSLHYENLPQSETPQQEDEEAQKQKSGGKVKKIGQKMKVIGHGLKQFGGKVNVKCKEHIKEIRATQEAAKKRSREQKEKEQGTEPASEPELQEKPKKAPRTSFRFRKRPLNDEESFQNERKVPVVEAVQVRPQTPKHQESSRFEFSEGQEPPVPAARSQKRQGGQGTKVKRNDVLGRADRDWESPLDLIQSRDASEEPFSGRYSPPGSSTTSSRRQGVLEEIDSDEFFLRERGISEGEDEEEVNRLLMHELRQTFRPLNSLEGFDLPTPPPRPTRSPRKPPRKTRDGGKEPNFQTFPPERPKRKQAPGYISAYLNQQEQKQNDEKDSDDFRRSEEDEFMAMESDEDEDEGIRRVKLELRRIDQDMEDEKVRYEPVLSESPLRPRRNKKDKSKSKRKDETEPSRPQIFYYNTIGANEWMKDLESQIADPEEEVQSQAPAQTVANPPVAPKRVRRKSEGGKSSKSETQLSDIDNTTVSQTKDGSNGNQDDTGSLTVQVDKSEDSTIAAILDLNDSMEYVDYEEDPGGGYAKVVNAIEKERPKTVPRRKHRDKSKKTHSLKRRSKDGGNGKGKTEGEPAVSSPVFCSLPRYTPRTFHIVPPTRPHRTYSSLRPKRPPRHQAPKLPHESDPSTSQQQGTVNNIRGSPSLGPRDAGGSSLPDERERTSSGTPTISMQGRPLPPPPRPQRSPVPMNDLDHTNIERMVGIRHYANFMGDDEQRVPVVEELVVKKNIPLLGREDEEIESVITNTSEANVGIQTDPVQGEDDFDLNAIGSFEEEDGIDKQRDSSYHTKSDGRGVDQRVPILPARSPSPRPRQGVTPAAPSSTEVIFPTRLHLDELEVDFLRVNELTAQSITMDHLHAPQLYVDSMSSSGALVVPLIQSSNLAVDQINTERVSTNDFSSGVTGVSVPPPSFYQLTAPQMRSTSEEGTGAEMTGISQTEQPFRQQPTTRPLSGTTPSAGQIVRQPSTDDVFQLSSRLCRAVFRMFMRGLDGLTEYLDTATSNDPQCQAQQRSQIQILLCLLLILVVGIFLLSGGTSSSEPRWEFFLPPPDL